MPKYALPRGLPAARLIAGVPAAVAFLSFIFMSIQGMSFGVILVALLLAMFALMAALDPKGMALTVLRWWPLLLFPALAMVSALWSDYPAISLRYGAQLFFTCLLGIYLGRTLRPAQFLAVLFASMFVFCLLCIAYGRQGVSAEGSVLIGLTGSKNQIGFVAQLLLIAALAVLVDPGSARPLRLAALCSLPVAAFVLWQANATGAVLLAAAGIALFLGFAALQRLQPGGRLALFVGAVCVITPLLFLMPEILDGVNYFVTDTLGKDPTLTGRTYLWERAAELSARRPLLGYGYQAIWVGDSADTIGLLRWAGLEDGRTFSFHNTFIQARVDIGLVGMLLFIGIMAATFLAAARQFLLRPTIATSFFFTMFLLYCGRAFAEAIIGPLSAYTALYFACCTIAFRQPQAAERGAQAPEAPTLASSRRFGLRAPLQR